jgi:hypothetical protein
MTSTESRPDGPRAGWLWKIPGRLLKGARNVILALS